ncbi:LytR/AlgR family response regulator transcription factor [Paracidobacterium acidisoli]|uniref:DNA-binding response regulator n=1 Tax=Paracidobacterium acidisoli TaxID=2303751 RepID=A0A372IM59_9BACT|nr:LytTR family DNA-binding domain-containing protein [Paracidobacterium acidisoli]MBT9332451.1 LytTR family DNA-binding domain-containing protein [Paracidobacterium acidisoli]
MKLKTLIADDEPLARERLRFLLAGSEEIELAGECRNGREVVAALRESRIDLLFLDIQMPGRDGFDVFEQIGAANMPVTVFVTAHNQYAVQAFEVHALDYLTKPVEPERLQSALLRVREQIASRNALLTQERLRSVLAGLEKSSDAPKEYPRRLLVPNGAKESFISVSEIEWIEAADYYSCLHVGARSLMLRETIRQLACTLDPKKFVRIHRSTIVNVDQVREIFREGRSEGSVVLLNGQRLKMSKTGWQNLLAVSRA